MKDTGYCAAVQMDAAVGNLKKNTEHITRILKDVKSRKPETVFMVFPEMVLYGYSELEKINTIMQQEIDECLLKIARICRDESVSITVGAPYIERTDKSKDPVVYNSLYLITHSGRIQNIYSKLHLIQAEQNVIRPGSSYTICEMPFGRVGFLICWDLGFAEAARLYAKEKIDLLVVSAAWEKPYKRQWELAVCGRAFDNGIPVIASNRIGQDGAVIFAGHSMITDNMGNILSQCMEEEGYVMETLAFLQNREEREQFGSQLQELREDTYRSDHIRVIKIAE